MQNKFVGVVTKTTTNYLVFSFLLCGFFLRFLNLGKSFWLDEGWTINKLPNLFSLFSSEPFYVFNPYYVIAHYFTIFFGVHETSLRLLSVSFSLASITLLGYFIAKKYGIFSGLLMAAIFSLSPYGVVLSQEVRMYSLAGLFAVMHMYLVMNFIEQYQSGKTISDNFFVKSFAVNCLLVFTHLSGAILLFSEGIVFCSVVLLKNWSIRKRENVMFLLAYLVTAIGLFAVNWKRILMTLGFLQSDGTYIENMSSQNTFVDLINLVLKVFTGVSNPVLYVLIAMFLLSLLHRKMFSSFFKLIKEDAFLIFLMIISVFIAISFTGGTITVRHYFVIFPYVVFVLSTTLLRLKERHLFLGSFFIVLFLYFLLHNAIALKLSSDLSFARGYRAVAERLDSSSRDFQAVFIPDLGSADLFKYYFRRDVPIIAFYDYKDISENEIVKMGEFGLDFYGDEQAINSAIERLSIYENFVLVKAPALDFNDTKGFLLPALEKIYDLDEEDCLGEICLRYYMKK